jgi:hypothetical protein
METLSSAFAATLALTANLLCRPRKRQYTIGKVEGKFFISSIGVSFCHKGALRWIFGGDDHVYF